MTKKFFTNVSPKAVEGIRKAYSGTPAEVTAVFDPATGQATVVVEWQDLPFTPKRHHKRHKVAA